MRWNNYYILFVVFCVGMVFGGLISQTITAHYRPVSCTAEESSVKTQTYDQKPDLETYENQEKGHALLEL